MKKAIGWIVSWSLFWLGDLVSKALTERTVWVHRPYRALMLASVGAQEWSGAKGPWGPREALGEEYDD